MIENKKERIFSCSGNKVNYVSAVLVYDWFKAIGALESANVFYCIRQYEVLAEMAMGQGFCDTALRCYIKIFNLALKYDWDHMCMRNKDSAFRAAYAIKNIYDSKAYSEMSKSYYIDEVESFYLDLYYLIYNLD